MSCRVLKIRGGQLRYRVLGSKRLFFFHRNFFWWALGPSSEKESLWLDREVGWGGGKEGRGNGKNGWGLRKIPEPPAGNPGKALQKVRHFSYIYNKNYAYKKFSEFILNLYSWNVFPKLAFICIVYTNFSLQLLDYWYQPFVVNGAVVGNTKMVENAAASNY